MSQMELSDSTFDERSKEGSDQSENGFDRSKNDFEKRFRAHDDLKGTVVNPASTDQIDENHAGVAGITMPPAGKRENVNLWQVTKGIFYFAEGSDRLLIALGVFFNFVNGCAMPVFLQVFGGLVNSLGSPSATDRGVDYYVKIQLYVGVASFLVSGLGSALLEYAAEKQLRVARMRYLSAVLRQDMGWFDSFDGGTLASRLNQNCIEIREGLGLKLGQLFMFAAMFIGGYISGFIRNWKMALVLSAALPFLAGAGFFMIRMMSNASKGSQKAYSRAGSIAEEILAAIRTVAAFGSEMLSLKRYNALLDGCMREGLKGGIASGVGMGATLGIMFCSFALGFWFGAKMIVESYNNNCTTNCFRGGDALTVFFSILMGAFALGQAGPPLSAFMKAGTAVADMKELIERQSKIDPWESGGLKDVPLKGDVLFKNVTFAYPTRKEKNVYSSLDLSIPAGKTVALVGASGCGKSTATQLIQRFYDPDAGSVTIDGIDLREFNVQWLRDQMSLVSQEPRLFARTIAENIQDGREGATRADIEAAAVAANAMGFISKFPEGLDTFVGEAGSQLSGGQKQRIAIARAMLRNPTVLILDEATSALDNESEKIVQMTLDKLLAERQRTTIVIAHRLSTVRRADKIVVLANPTGDGASVAEEGTHEELMQLENGIYRNLVLAQGLETDLHQKRQLSRDMTDKSLEIALASETPRPGPQDLVGHLAISQRQLSNVLRSESKLLLEGSHLPFEKTAQDASFSRSVSRAMSAVLVGDEHLFEEIRSVEPDLPPVKYSRVLGMLKPYWREVLCGLIGSAAAGCVFPVYSLLLGKFLTVYFYTHPDDMMSEASYWSLWFLAIAALALVSTSLQRTFMEWAGHRLVRVLRSKTFEQMLYQDMAFFDHPAHSTGTLVEILASDVLLIKGMAGDNLGVMVQNIATLLAAVIIAFSANAKLAAVAFACFLVIAPAAYVRLKFETSGAKDIEGDAKTAGHVINEAVTNIRVITAYNLQRRMLQVYDVVLEHDFRDGRRTAFLGGFFLGLANFLQFAAQALPLWYGGKLMENGEISDAGKLMTATTAVMMAAMGIGQSMIFATDVGKARQATARVFGILDRQPAIDCRSDEGKMVDNTAGGVSLQKVRFRYPMRPESIIFRSISLSIMPGETVALVGASGCGKSTIVQLLERFYDPERSRDGRRSGAVDLDGIDLRDINVRSLRGIIGLVGQEPVLFDTSIGENIKYGKPDATLAEIEEAARNANAHNFIIEFPEGYDTFVGKAGSQLSGGQKQRIAIARAMIRDPKILLLDEATSALDSESEKQVQAALDDLMSRSRRTTIMIAHRLSTVKNADRIIVLANPDNEGSEVVESGTHEELMRISNGVYRGLVNVAVAAGEK